MKTTLNKIRKSEPCVEGWQKLLEFLGKTKADDEELSLKTIFESNGLVDALWCLRTVEGYDREKRLFAVFCAKHISDVLEYNNCKTEVEEAIKTTKKYANGKATKEDLDSSYRAYCFKEGVLF